MRNKVFVSLFFMFLLGFLLTPAFSVFAETETRYTSNTCTAGTETTTCTSTPVYKKIDATTCTPDSEYCTAENIAAREQLKLTNPLRVNSLLELIEAVLNIVWKLGIPVITLAILYCGFLFIQARGKPEDLKKAKMTFFWVVVGAAIILGAWVLAKAIAGTVQRLQAVGPEQSEWAVGLEYSRRANERSEFVPTCPESCRGSVVEGLNNSNQTFI